MAVRAVLARAPALTAAHLCALASAASSDLTRCIDLETLARVALPERAGAYLTFPDERLLDSDLRWIDSAGAKLIAALDPSYPELLLQLADAPPVLYLLGQIEQLGSKQIAMVGARNATAQGCRAAREFAAEFAGARITVTSGLAAGIDAHSHEGALSAAGATIAVCGTGLDRIYPTQHAGLAERIRGQGALVSEFPPGTPPLRANFPRRNRVISGLSSGIVVVEAARQSGSLSTARHALRQGRPVFARPGPVGHSLSGGCHELIRAGARLVEKPSQVLSQLGIPHKNERVARRRDRRAAAAAMDKGYEMLLDALGFEPATVDVLAFRTGLTAESIASMLLVLELQGHVASYPGGRFGRIP